MFVPFFRTPLGTVGLGGFFAQPHASSSQSDENKPGSSSHGHSSEQSVVPSGSSMGNSGNGKQKNRQGKSVRLNINARCVLIKF